jgi:hypothetical protein
MRGIQFSKQTLFLFLLISTFSLTLSGCLVESSDPLPVTERTTDNLRIINSGDFLVYRLSGQRSTNGTVTGVSGRMTVTWTDDIIPNPHIPGTNVDVLKEETVVEYDNAPTSTTVRYVTQDPDGSLNVHAFRQKADILYAGDYIPSQIQFTYQPIQFVSSPLANTSTTFSYRVLDACGETECAVSLRQITEANEFTDDVAITIDAGKQYQTLYYVYTGFFLENNTAPLQLPFDFRTSCASIPITEITGEYYYFPEVGLVRFLSSCTGIDDSNGNNVGHRISGSLISASFPLP